MRKVTWLAVTVGVLGLSACGGTEGEPEVASAPRGVVPPRGIGKFDGTDSCKGICGKKAPAGCWCDESCAKYGDCCKDKVQQCSAPTPTPTPKASCTGVCGKKSADGCWCDEGCAKYGDCCPDKATTCAATSECPKLAPPAPSFCPNGKVVPTLDAAGKCVTGYVCLAITTDKKSYTAGQAVVVSLKNVTQKSVFLGGCSVFGWEKQEKGAWQSAGPDHICVWEGLAGELKPGKTHTETLASKGAGTWRISAGYGVGCLTGKALSQAQCASSDVTFSAPFTVGAAVTCYKGGCSGQVCSPIPDVVTTCEWLPWYACTQQTDCGAYGPNGTCAWNPTPAFKQCMAQNGGPQ